MRVYGYCLICRKFRPVTISDPRQTGIPIGQCAACERGDTDGDQD